MKLASLIFEKYKFIIFLEGMNSLVRTEREDWEMRDFITNREEKFTLLRVQAIACRYLFKENA